jgi:DNA-binding transcriptional ArsR family regulator
MWSSRSVASRDADRRAPRQGAAFDLGQPTISHHLAKLREAGLVTSVKRGIWAFYQLNPLMSEPARSAVALIR